MTPFPSPSFKEHEIPTNSLIFFDLTEHLFNHTIIGNWGKLRKHGWESKSISSFIPQSSKLSLIKRNLVV